MLQPIIRQLSSKRVVLASGSPRRQELVKNIGLNADLCPSLFEENLNYHDFPTFGAFVEETALQKVLEVSARLLAEKRPADIIIGADTMVTLGDEMFGKPETPEKAFETLSKLVGRSHVVYTGVVIKFGEHITKFTESTVVHFGKVSDEQIRAYVATGEPLDKAGGYGIQGVGGTMVERIEGDFFTVMGLPLYRLSCELCKLFESNTESKTQTRAASVQE